VSRLVGRMSRFRGRGPQPVSQAVRRVLIDAQDRQTIRMALLNGATATPIGPVTHIRLPGRQDSMQFPTEMVDEVRRGMDEAAE
jgi:hypothetical protein